MAYTIINNRNFGIFSTVSNTIKKLFDAIYNWLVAISVAQSRSDVIERMNQMTDEELSSRYNITRDQIVTYVFADKMY